MDMSKQELNEMVKPIMSPTRREWTNIDKTIACLLFFLHALCIFAPFHFTWSAFWVAVVLYSITGLFGITISYHRNLSHKSFKLPKWLEYLFSYCGVQAFQGDPIDWVSTHRCHHQFVDTDNDPHDSNQGFWFSHITWVLDSYNLTKKVCDNVKDLEKQIFYTFIHKTYLLHPIALAVLLYMVGGLPFVLWGMCVRIVMSYHAIFMVNSVCHKWGKKQWNTTDLSRNNWWVSLLTFGEGWHNNHHAFEYSARYGLEWWQLDFAWYVIMFLKAIGVATDVKLPTQSHKQRMKLEHIN
ncbi:palmitoyl-monogalactosyldiacylglycerol delta-7 desaturase, chloroplastic-like isoform X2 [Cucumis melo]|uniref:Palmitoyl-monogalactosyldiacylglycerol delta-7 desaturase, chloroplastic-like isoform X2 n=1 Tax=Cucumis melo TaxID=3656 RepID=A0ABM3L012_CUCME|nr:palmitoyl-monogalactosyldiacylglycerol delta-7 desaturase, chloroplastic-like isoform X2 [Cucumis melo]